MANFPTHAAVGVVTSGMLATLTMAADIVPARDLVTLALAGTFGAVLPDIDLESSRASRAVFAGLGVFLAFASLFNVFWKYSVAEMWIVWVGTYLTVRYLAHNIFHKYARHRGVFHSLTAGVFFGCGTSALYFHLFRADPTLAWLAGAFVLFGYVVHLTLDEIFSVDFFGNRVKRSFGTALKIYDSNSIRGSLTMASAALIAFLAAPSIEPIVNVVSSPEVWAELQDRMLPGQSWFGLNTQSDNLATLSRSPEQSMHNPPVPASAAAAPSFAKQ